MSLGGSIVASFEYVESFFAVHTPPDHLIRTNFEQEGVIPEVVFDIFEKLVFMWGWGLNIPDNEVPRMDKLEVGVFGASVISRTGHRVLCVLSLHVPHHQHQCLYVRIGKSSFDTPPEFEELEFDKRELIQQESDLVEISDMGMRIFFVMSKELLVLNEVKQTVLKLKVVRGDFGHNDGILVTLGGCFEQLSHKSGIIHLGVVEDKLVFQSVLQRFKWASTIGGGDVVDGEGLRDWDDNLHEMASASPICLIARATSSKSWLLHQRLSHLNYDTINDLAKNDLVTGLPKFKYHKEHLCPSCEQGKNKKATHPPKTVPNSKQKLHLIHMDLCGPMRVKSINGKLYVLRLLLRATLKTALPFTVDLETRQSSFTPRLITNWPTNSSSQAADIPSTSQDVDELEPHQQHVQQQNNQASLQPEIVVDNVPNAMFNGDVFENPFAPPSTSAAESSSSQYVDSSNMHITMEPRNVKEAMTDPTWIESMQEELLQFKRLDVWVLVPAPDNIKPLTLKWLFKNKHDEENTVIRNKTRLVVRGYRQEKGIDFE
ncbi:retrovirus-related pol polyprotein from transposon TNT 1-94 [Tanacetum coccineum]|uniref:Retrovirus-related pol polyprotein from transposon TNT 1-94 n=1 Tax=Tanacetum coccineum TaxID=301880 RepID=A0ABQ5JAT5_9ASTR